MTAGGWSCPHGIVVYTRQTGASESHAVMRMPRQRADAPRDGRPAIREISRRARPDGRPDHGSRLLGRRPAPGSSPHRQAGVTETRRGGGSGAPGIPHPIERRPRASQSILFVRRRGCRRRGCRRRGCRRRGCRRRGCRRRGCRRRGCRRRGCRRRGATAPGGPPVRLAARRAGGYR